jgi:chaperonin GroEL (HSP60 family)
MLDKFKNLTKSRRFWVTISTVVVVVAKEAGIADLDPAQVQNIVILAATWVLGESLRSSEGPVTQ